MFAKAQKEWQNRKLFRFEVDEYHWNGLILHFDHAPFKYNQKDISTYQVKKIKRPKPIKEVSEVLVEDGRLELSLPIVTVSESNCNETWKDKHIRHKVQKHALKRAIGPFKINICQPCVVTWVRYGPKLLDEHDNLRMAFKWLADGLAEELTGDYRPGKADETKSIIWQYGQVKSKEYYIKLIVEWDSKLTLPENV